MVCPNNGRISVTSNLLQSRNLLFSLFISSMRICSNEQINLKISLPLFMNIDQFSAQMSLGELYLENRFDQESMDGFIFQCS